MMMNEYDVDAAAAYWRGHPVLGPATETLKAYVGAVNACSDGWPYWDAGRKPTEKLQGIIQAATDGYRRVVADAPVPTAAEVRKAIRPMKAFATRRKISVIFTDPA